VFNLFKKKEKELDKYVEAYKCVKGLSNVIFDVNPDIKKIRRLNAHYGTRLFEVDTAQGLRYIKISDGYKEEETKKFVNEFNGKPINYNWFTFYEYLTKVETKDLNGTGADTLIVRGKRLFNILLDSDEKTVQFYPELCESSPVTEEEIYLCLEELRDILAESSEPTLTIANKNRVDRFVERFVD